MRPKRHRDKLRFLDNDGKHAMKKIVFSDLDGTLINSDYEITPATLGAIQNLQEKECPFVIVSARSPMGIESVMKVYGIRCSIIALNGALILDAQRKFIYAKGIRKSKAAVIIDFLERGGYDTTWCIYAFDQWLVKDVTDPRIVNEASVVKAVVENGTIGDVEGDEVHKIMCICDPDESLRLEKDLKAAFPKETVVRSSAVLIEIVHGSVSKSAAVRKFCDYYGTLPQNAVAFGDNDNDMDMLECVGTGILMGNARDDLKQRFANVTRDHNNDGIYHALVKLGMI